MNKIIASMFVVLMSVQVSFAQAPSAQAGIPFATDSVSPTGEMMGTLDGSNGNKDHQQNYQCWAQTTCNNGQQISCSATGSYSCHWEARDAAYVRCEATNIDGSSSRAYVNCPF